MKHKIFVDSDVILDLLAKRDPFYLAAGKLFTLVDRGKIQANTSPVVFANIHFILRKLTSKKTSIAGLRKLRVLVQILPIDEKIVDQALSSDFTDFEDALQYYTAENNRIEFIITRNTQDYKESTISVCTPQEYLDIYEAAS